MESTRSNDRSRAEINHSDNKQSNNLNHNQQQRPMVPLKLNISSHSEPIPQSRLSSMPIFTENTENIPPPSTMFKMPINGHHQHNNHKISNDRLDEDMTTNHRQFSFEMDRSYEHDGDHNHDHSSSEPEPSPTPIVSDLEDLLIDTPNRYNIENYKQDTDDDPVHDINIDHMPSSFPVHGISIPYNLEDDDSDTPEPLDTPQTPGGYEANYNYNLVSSSELAIKIPSDYDAEQEDVEEEDVVISDDAFISEDLPPIKPKLRLSTSWKEKTMTRRTYRRSQRITCITPISQEMAVLKIRNYSSRRHSVANITPSVHRLFKLDPDLMKIREEYLERQKSKNSVMNDDMKEQQESDGDEDEEPIFMALQSDDDEVADQLNDGQQDEADDVDLLNDINVMIGNKIDL